MPRVEKVLGPQGFWNQAPGKPNTVSSRNQQDAIDPTLTLDSTF